MRDGLWGFVVKGDDLTRLFEEEEGKGTVTMLVHANYLGREFQRAEQCLAEGREYVQD